MTTKLNFTAYDRLTITQLLAEHEEHILSDIEHVIDGHVAKIDEKLQTCGFTLPTGNPSTDHFTHVIMCKLFSRLHQENKHVANTIIHNLKGQAGLI